MDGGSDVWKSSSDELSRGPSLGADHRDGLTGASLGCENAGDRTF